MFVFTNPNPDKKLVGDCVVRGIAIVMDLTWTEAYDDLCNQGRLIHDMPSSNEAWDQYLIKNGFKKYVIPDTCKDGCYTVKCFCEDNRSGIFLLATGSHVVAVMDGDYYDIWDSGNEVPIYYYKR